VSLLSARAMPVPPALAAVQVPVAP
jgi:hypothetical protein